MAKQKVALECLSYHATASQDQTVKLAKEPIRSAEEYKLYSFKFIGELRPFNHCSSMCGNLRDFPLSPQISSFKKRKHVVRR